MSDKRNELLKIINEQLQDAEDFEEVSLFTKDELDAPVDIVRGMLTEVGTELVSVLAEFFFLPYEDEEMLYFTSAITVTDEILKDELVDISMAVARINFDLPCGGFSIGPDGESLRRVHLLFAVLAESEGQVQDPGLPRHGLLRQELRSDLRQAADPPGDRRRRSH